MSYRVIGKRLDVSLARRLTASLGACVAVAWALGFQTGQASAQTYGVATLPPGALNHTIASAIAKVMKDRAGLNLLVQPTSGDTVILPMVNRGEADFGTGNIYEVHNGYEGAGPGGKLGNLRLVAVTNILRTGFWVRKDSNMYKVADLRGKRVGWVFSAMPTIGQLAKAMIATGGLTEKDIQPMPVPNVVRGADDFASGSADTYEFAFGAPKVREVDATVGGTRFLEVDEKLMPEARKFFKWAYLTDVEPGPIYIGVTKPMKVFSFDNMIYANASVKDDVVYKMLDTMEKHKEDMAQIVAVMREYSAAGSYKKYNVPFHPGALKYFKDHNLQPMEIQ